MASAFESENLKGVCVSRIFEGEQDEIFIAIGSSSWTPLYCVYR